MYNVHNNKEFNTPMMAFLVMFVMNVGSTYVPTNLGRTKLDVEVSGHVWP